MFYVFRQSQMEDSMIWTRLRHACFPLILMATGAFALYPYWKYDSMLLFKCEGGEIAIKTRFKATISGVETWYREYRSIIEDFVDDGYAYAYLTDQWGYCQVNAVKLATTCYYDESLELQDAYNSDVHSALIQALRDDSSGYSITEYYCGGGCAGQWDPYSDWKWRSYYMEDRYISNADTRDRNANCWGTADYLARDFEWRDMYVDEFPSGAPDWEHKFPNIYLEGGKWYPPYWGYPEHYNPHCIDDDLDPGTNGRAVYRGRTSGTNPDPSVKPEELINSFCVVRLAVDPQTPKTKYELEPASGHNVGENLHCLAYLCTDEGGDVWMYEKGNYGSTDDAPYGLRILGTGGYSTRYRSFFKKYGNNKDNFADSYQLNWAGITE
jgi:hypothetical protein